MCKMKKIGERRNFGVRNRCRIRAIIEVSHRGLLAEKRRRQGKEMKRKRKRRRLLRMSYPGRVYEYICSDIMQDTNNGIRDGNRAVGTITN